MDHLFRRAANKLNSYELVLGVIDDGKRKEKGVTNSDLLFIHEFGSIIKNIPARPVLQETIDDPEVNKWINESSVEAFSYFLENKDALAVRELNILAMRIQTLIRKKLRRGEFVFEPLKIKTIKRKRSNLPLYDTGQLAKSIVCVIKKKII